MISAVVMAGYANKREVSRYSKTVADHYGETFVESGYKPLREFSTIENGITVSKPVVQFTLEKLLQIKEIDDIVVVGHQMLLEQRLGEFFAGAKKNFTIINQNKPLSQDVMDAFGIVPQKVKFNSLAGNMIKGYAATQSAEKKTHALFVASDAPLTTERFMEGFMKRCKPLLPGAAVIVPVMTMIGKEDKLGRKPLWLVNDSTYQPTGFVDAHGRQGFRLSSILFADPNRFNVNTVNAAYNLRKLLSPAIQIRLFTITRGLGFSNVYSKYFMKKDLRISDCEKITSQFFSGNLVLVPMEGEEASYDYDGTEKEYQMINDMLMDTVHRPR